MRGAMAERERNDTPTGLSPSADSPAQKRRKVTAGRGLLILIIGITVGAFSLYVFIAVYGLFTSS
jgi:hypothetical protein